MTLDDEDIEQIVRRVAEPVGPTQADAEPAERAWQQLQREHDEVSR